MLAAAVAPGVRILAAASLIALLLAGCAFPGTEPAKEKDPLFGLCPQWEQGPGGYSSGAHLTPDARRTSNEIGLAPGEYQGKPFDLYRINLSTLDVDGRLELRAFDASGGQLAIRDYRQDEPQLMPVVTFTDGAAKGHEFEVYLSPVTQDKGPSHQPPATLQWTLDGEGAEVAFDVTFHYKVCGAGDL